MSRIRDILLPGGRRIPSDFISATFTRSSGPGGQNVNKLATKADIRLDLKRASSVLSSEELARVRNRLAARLDGDGRLRVVSSEHRSQQRNLEAGIVRLESMIAAALRPPRTRRRTNPSAAARRRRIEQKRRRGHLKAGRSRGDRSWGEY